MKALLGYALCGALLAAGIVRSQQVAKPTSALLVSGPQQPSMGVALLAPLWPDSANITGTLEVTLPRGGYITAPAMVRVERRLKTGTVWRAIDATKPIRIEPGQHLRLSQRP